MDTFSIIQGIHFSLCSDAGKSYYIINTLYNAINILCHKSASCLLGLPASGVWALQSNKTSLFHLQRGRSVYICFPLILENTLGPHTAFLKLTTHASLFNLSLFFLYHTQRLAQISFVHCPTVSHLWQNPTQNWHDRGILTSFPVCFTFVPPVLLLPNKATTLFCWPGAGFPPPPSLTELRQSIYPDLARIDGGCRDCEVDSMLQDLFTDRHTAWQLQNGASMQPSDFASPSCFISFAISLWLFFNLLYSLK